MYKTLVAYFSATGTTKKIALRIAEESNSDIIEIIPKEEYKKEDLDFLASDPLIAIASLSTFAEGQILFMSLTILPSLDPS